MLGGELEESGQRVQTSRAPPSRVRRPAGETPPSGPLPLHRDLEGAPGPNTLCVPTTSPPQPRARNTEGRLTSPAPAARPPARVQERPPIHGLAGDMRSCRRSKGTRLLLRKTTFCRLQLSHPTSLPSLPLPRETVSSSPTAETRRAAPAVTKLPGDDISHQVGPKSKHQERRTEVKIHGDSRRESIFS